MVSYEWPLGHTPSDVMAKRDHERDMDLDKKIEALRRKNAALMRRYQEVEEDKKMAEEDLMALPGRKGKADDLSITISKSTSESRVVVTKPCAGVKVQLVAGSSRAAEAPLPGSGRGRKKQLTVTMAGKKGKRVVSERVEPGAPGADVRGPDEDRQGQGGEAAGGAKHAPHASSKRDAGATQECEFPPACTDLTVPTSPEEQEEYMCWKRERERIDRERVARHKNAKGQWRRAWDVDKSESMFSDKSLPEKERGLSSRGGRNARRGHPRSHPQDSQGPVRDKVKDKGSKSVPVVSSKAKGKDRLTGRARRSTSDTTLEEFLEELDALTEPEDKEEEEEEEDDDDDDDDGDGGENRKDTDHLKVKISLSPEAFKSGDAPSGSASKGPEKSGGASSVPPLPPRKDAVVSSPRGTGKRVRFSEELFKGAAPAPATEGPAVPGPGEAGEVPPPSRRTQRESDGPQEDVCNPPPDPSHRPEPVVQQQVSFPTEHGETASDPPPAEQSAASRQESAERPTEHAKRNISSRNTEELIDTGLSVLSLESRDTCSTDTANTDKVSKGLRRYEGPPD
ncbi:Coiled-coil domain-containing protein 9B [Merluccius polli]|uniref:Coiled-coil domain-containing protein 9B n=1 Tax=Merluccius polli TaxID=89951 RepID=A0AA47PB70_MERPO|nr:Coiled-coil domain-containing protein 9B [Merluccius polli]